MSAAALHSVRLPLGGDDCGRILDRYGDVVAWIADDGLSEPTRAALAKLIAAAVNQTVGLS